MTGLSSPAAGSLAVVLLAAVLAAAVAQPRRVPEFAAALPGAAARAGRRAALTASE